ncbi:M48 family metalloprotease [Desulfosarcina sp. OttesenSCG-928-B08]|nr:M48 family metalloprotease [Desulfosarcina sp. OttesenSCG-928-B08]
MKKPKKITLILTLAAFFLSLGIFHPPDGRCISIQEERELSKEFMAYVKARYPLITDPVIVEYVNQVGNRIMATIPPQPFTYQFYVVNEPVYNAFATPGGHIFINSGLFAAMESEQELAGILGHEIAHVVCRHISQRIEKSKKIGMASLAGLVVGALLGVGGAGDAAGAVTMGTMAAGQSASLAYSRENEIQADQIGLDFLTQAGYSGEGLLTALKKIRGKQWYGSEQIPTYLNTHPASEDRMSYLDNWLHHTRRQSAPRRPETGRFRLAHTRLVALYTDTRTATEYFRSQLSQSPKDAMARYGYALVLTRENRWAEAISHMQQAIEGNAMATDMLQDLGMFYFHNGQYEQAVNTLSASRSKKYPQGLLYLGRSQLELGQLADARETFQDLVADHEDYAQACYYLGETSGRLGDMFDAHYYLGRFYLLKQDLKNADFHLKRAMTLARTDAEKAQASAQLRHLSPEKDNKKTDAEDSGNAGNKPDGKRSERFGFLFKENHPPSSVVTKIPAASCSRR